MSFNHTNPVYVYWRSRYTGRVTSTSLGSDALAAKHAAALQSLGHVILTDEEFATHLATLEAEASDSAYSDTEQVELENAVNEFMQQGAPNDSFREELEGMGITELRKFAKPYKISGAWSLKKAELVEAILKVSN